MAVARNREELGEALDHARAAPLRRPSLSRPAAKTAPAQDPAIAAGGVGSRRGSRTRPADALARALDQDVGRRDDEEGEQPSRRACRPPRRCPAARANRRPRRGRARSAGCRPWSRARSSGSAGSASCDACFTASTSGSPAVAQLVGELDDQDRVLGDEAHQHHEPDLAEQVERRLAVASSATSAPVKESATATRMVTGCTKLSNWAASTR